MRETYLGFDPGDIVSGEMLTRMRRHYKLDTILRCVYLPAITVKWDDSNIPSKNMADAWKCVGRTDLYLIFDWLKNVVGVKKVVEVVVVDDSKDRKPHSDQAIKECLRDLDVEIWNWKRMDISSELIYTVAGDYVSVVYLYCSGVNAVLRGWSDINGLAKLQNVGSGPGNENIALLTLLQLKTVHLEVHQVFCSSP